MHPTDSSILTCPVLCLQAGALLWDISCYLKALRKPQVTQTVLEDEYMCRIIAPVWHIKQHFVKACDRGRIGMLRKEGNKWFLIDPMSQHVGSLTWLLSLWATAYSHFCSTHRLKEQEIPVSGTDRWVFLPWACPPGLTGAALLSQLHEAWGCLGHPCVHTGTLQLSVSSTHRILHQKENNCTDILLQVCDLRWSFSWKLFHCWKSNK